MNVTSRRTKPFDTTRSIKNATKNNLSIKQWTFVADNKTYIWFNKMDRIRIVRKGIPYESIDVISKKLNKPVKSILDIINLPQTTYNKKKAEHSLLNSQNSELILLIFELIDFGLEVFNNEEEKFLRWLTKNNLVLGNNAPESMLDTITGINEVKYSLNRLEFGNLA